MPNREIIKSNINTDKNVISAISVIVVIGCIGPVNLIHYIAH